jgi:hypothetical protein
MSRIGIALRPAAEMRSGRTALCALCNQSAAASAASSGKGRKMGSPSLDLVPEASPHPCYNLPSPERGFVEVDPVISSAGGSIIRTHNSENQSIQVF